jgi:protein TonB
VTRRFFTAVVIGFLVTLGLFWLMQLMILNPDTGLKESKALKMVEFIRLKREDRVIARRRPVPEIPAPKKKPSPPAMKLVKANPTATPAPQIDMPKLDIPSASVHFEGSLISGLKIGTGTGIGSGTISSDLVPIFRVPPVYPMRAQKRRIEGWVRVEFTIDTRGHVVDPVVVESDPKGVFDRSALNAVSEWKFKPKIVANEAVEQRAVQELVFKLGNH